jgi:hypothetical protein
MVFYFRRIYQMTEMLKNVQYDRSDDDNSPMVKGEIRRKLNQKETALLDWTESLGLQNKHLAFLFSNSLQTIKNQNATIYRVLGVMNCKSAIRVWKEIKDNYGDMTKNPFWVEAKKEFSKYASIQDFLLAVDQWNSNVAGSSEYPKGTK